MRGFFLEAHCLLSVGHYFVNFLNLLDFELNPYARRTQLLNQERQIIGQYQTGSLILLSRFSCCACVYICACVCTCVVRELERMEKEQEEKRQQEEMKRLREEELKKKSKKAGKSSLDSKELLRKRSLLEGKQVSTPTFPLAHRNTHLISQPVIMKCISLMSSPVK